MNKLEQMVYHAYNNSPFYMNLKEKCPEIDLDDFSTLPVVRKDDFYESRCPLISMDSIVGYADNERIIEVSTSGSTGKCLNVSWNINDFNRSLLPLWVLRKKYYGINPWDRMCYFYTISDLGEYDKESMYNKNGLGFSKIGLDEKKILEIYDEIREYSPVWLIMQPSIAVLLLNTVKLYGIPAVESIRYVEFTGEMLSASLRKETEDFFCCRVADQYGCQEVNSIAFECPEGNMHCLSSSVKVEILDGNNPAEDGKEGAIVITSLNNFTMPFVRYSIGDRGYIRNGVSCHCGCSRPILKLTAGRSNDWVTGANGEKLNTYIFANAVININQMCDDVVRQYQIIQNDYDDFTVKLVIDDSSMEEEVISMFEEAIREESLRNAVFEFEFYRTILPDPANGKLACFISMI